MYLFTVAVVLVHTGLESVDNNIRETCAENRTNLGLIQASSVQGAAALGFHWIFKWKWASA